MQKHSSGTFVLATLLPFQSMLYGNKLLTSALTNDQVPLNGLGVILIRLHFLSSAIYPCSRHSLPIVFVSLLRVSINKILWVTLVPPFSAPVFMCVFICKCAGCGCFPCFFQLSCLSHSHFLMVDLQNSNFLPWYVFLVIQGSNGVLDQHHSCHQTVTHRQTKTLLCRANWYRWLEAPRLENSPALYRALFQTFVPPSTQTSRRRDIICQVRCNLRLQIRIETKM